MQNNLLLNPKEFQIDEMDGEKSAIYCKRLIEKWTPQLETEMLEAFIRLYYDEMYENWGPDDEEESKEYRTGKGIRKNTWESHYTLPRSPAWPSSLQRH